MKKSLILTLFIVLLNPIFSQEGDFSYDPKSKSVKAKYLGKVFLIRGSVTALSPSGKSSKLKKQSKIFPGDKLVTSKNSIVKIEMIDTTVITVAPLSEFIFSKWDYRTKDDRDAIFNVLKGKIRSHTKVKNKRQSNLLYKAGSVSMGIRGTRILANAYTRRDKIRVSHVVVLSGKTEIYDSASDKKFPLESGSEYISFLRPDGTLLKQTRQVLTAQKLKELKANDKNPNKYFKPFLASITSKDLKASKDSQESYSAKKKSEESTNRSRSRSRKKKSWRKTLDQLNKRLNESDD